MARISPLGATSAVATNRLDNSSGLDELDVDQFLTLLITELQNQDPLDPMDNSKLLAQISQIREIGSTDKLTDTLSAVQTGQNMTTASSLIGKEIRALSDDLQEVHGVVDRVTMGSAEEGSPIRVYVEGAAVSLQNIREIVG